VFLAGEEVCLRAPAEAAKWRAADYGGAVVGNGIAANLTLGRLSVGWYRISFLDTAGKEVSWTTAAVIRRLAAATPGDSPVCVDSATAWFSRRYRGEEKAKQEVFASLAALAGVNWIRDRLSWGQVEPKQGEFDQETLYDSSAELQAKHGLNALQVFHGTPGWAIDKTLDGRQAWKRFARDLRHHYRFCKAMAERFKGSILAWEPWNEANIEPFGGHTIDEMCSMQKAAYWGLRAADAGIRTCWNVYAGPGSRLHTEGVLLNEAWPYFETYNIHSYSRPDRYLREFETAREGACGRPIWITECGIRLRTDDEKPWGDLSPEDERRQAEFIAKSYACSLYAGVARHFFFILGNYIERGTQFGLLRHDLTPRPGYVALAAVGRLLAGAQCLGRLSPTAYVFQARPDGVEREVLVAWQDPAGPKLPGDLKIEALFDHLGRSTDQEAIKSLGAAPVFAVLPRGEARRLALDAPPSVSRRRGGAPSSIVLQASLPHYTARLGSQGHAVEPGKTADVPLFAYNFGDRPVAGAIAVEEAPAGWNVRLRDENLTLAPLERRPVALSVAMPSAGRDLIAGGWIRLRGEFGDAGRPALAFRLPVDLAKLEPAQTRPIAAGDLASNWQDNIMRKGVMSHAPAQPTGVLFDMRFADTDPWAYPRLRLKETDVPPNDFDGLALTVQVLEGTGTVRMQFVEASGASYLTEAGIDADNRQPQRSVVLFRHCKWGSFSKPDPDGKLQPSNIRTILVGINSKRNSTVKMSARGLEWVKF